MYCVRNITEDLYFVGVNDHRLHLFENIMPIQRGVSYNSYLLIDEKTVLFDTVDFDKSREFLRNVDSVLRKHNRTLDYLVVNHMEPDHASSIEQVIMKYPKVKIISTEKAFMFMRQFNFNVDGREIIIDKDENGNDDMKTFSSGKHEFMFVKAPMVHWPETMVTFDKTIGALFSADAFGTFVALDGRLFDDEVDFDREFLDEARRYYSNIVGKYGQFVQDLFKKLTPFIEKGMVKYLLPLHGPVWRKNLGYILEKYTRWSTYVPEEKGVLIVYASMYGNTEYGAEIMANKLVQRGVKNVRMYDVSKQDVSFLIGEVFKYSHILILSCTYNLGIYPKMRHFIDEMIALNVQNRYVAVIENGSWAPKAADLITEKLDEEMAMINIIDPAITINSAVKDDKESDYDDLANAIVESVEKVNIDL